MDLFHCHLDELERLLSDDDKKRKRMKNRALSFAAFVGSNPVVETLIQKGVGKGYKRPMMQLFQLEMSLHISVETDSAKVSVEIKINSSHVSTEPLHTHTLYC